MTAESQTNVLLNKTWYVLPAFYTQTQLLQGYQKYSKVMTESPVIECVKQCVSLKQQSDMIMQQQQQGRHKGTGVSARQ